MLNKADAEKSGVISTAMSFLSLYRDPIVAENVRYSDFSIEDLMGERGVESDPISLYLVVPPSDKDRLKPLIRLILNQVVRRLTEKMEFKDGRSVDGFAHRLLLMIDEFPSLGKLDIFAESLAYVAGYGMKMYLICQDTAQLYKEYTKDETIIANCHVRVIYAPNRLETAEWLSKILGKKTLVSESTTFSYNGQFMPYQTGMSGGLQYAGRELLTTEEVMSLRGPTKNAKGEILTPGAMVTLVAGKSPVYGTQMLYFLDKTFLTRARIPAPDAAEAISDAPTAVASADATATIPASLEAVQSVQSVQEITEEAQQDFGNDATLQNHEEEASAIYAYECAVRALTTPVAVAVAVEAVGVGMVPEYDELRAVAEVVEETKAIRENATQRHRRLEKESFKALMAF
jgi:type IV secretion system protein VirD4